MNSEVPNTSRQVIPSSGPARLGLGTVQFGLDYAIAENEGRPAVDDVVEILRVAAEAGIDLLDTAKGYGDAEPFLGRTLPSSTHFRVVTKTAPLAGETIRIQDAEMLERDFHGSLRDLGVDSVYGLLVHKAENLLADGGEYLFGVLESLKASGLVKKIGVSVYTAEQIEKLSERYLIDLIQVPVSILDQRLVRGGHLKSLKRMGVEVHARSVFLKGLLFAEPATLPPHFDGSKIILTKLRTEAAYLGKDPAIAALDFVLGLPEVDTVLIGVTHVGQLQAILDGLSKNDGGEISSPERFALSDPDVLNPAKWPAFKVMTA